VRGHADAETLAAFREELLSRRKAARVSAHLAACSRCAELDAQLTEVSALLTTSAAPPMPDALTARIEAAIAAEAAARAAAAADGTLAAADGTVAVGVAGAGTGSRDRAAPPSRPSRPPGGPGRARLALRVAAVTAAVVVVAGGGYGVARLLTANPESSTSAGSGSAAAPASGINGKASRQAIGGFRAPSAAGNSAPAARIIRSGTDYQPGQLDAQVSAVFTQHGTGAGSATSPGPSAAHQPAASVPRMPACVPYVTRGKRPLLVDLATYQGRPATVIVIPGATSGTLRALVVAGPCTATTGRVLARTTFPGSG